MKKPRTHQKNKHKLKWSLANDNSDVIKKIPEITL